MNRLFREISERLSPAQSEDFVLAMKRNYGEQFNSIENQDLLSCLDLLCKLGYVSKTKLTLIKELKEFVATKSTKEEISDMIDNFKASHPPKFDPEKELLGRSDDVKMITEKLERRQPSVVNLHGSAGVGKTKLAKEICAQWRGKAYMSDLREARDMRAIYLNIYYKLGLTVPITHLSLSSAVDRIHKEVAEEIEGLPVLFLLDNVEHYTAGQGKDGKNLRTAFLQFLGELLECDDKIISILLTSRTQVNDVNMVVDYELESLKDSFSEKILLPKVTSALSAQQKEKLLSGCEGKPLLLKGIAAILIQGRKAASDLVDELQNRMVSKEKTDTQYITVQIRGAS